VISFANAAGSIVLQGQWWDNAGIEAISFNGLTAWDEAEIAARYVSAQCTSGNDLIWGSNLGDTANAGAGEFGDERVPLRRAHRHRRRAQARR
jgi:hypothetical protein